jgi:chemotaxis receptor (MCP) glutamine deamidase CheD
LTHNFVLNNAPLSFSENSTKVGQKKTKDMMSFLKNDKITVIAQNFRAGLLFFAVFE